MDEQFEPLYDAYERDNGEPVERVHPRRAAEGVWADRERLDARHRRRRATAGRAERMAVLERNILRLAVWELQAGEVPAAVAIDEAVDAGQALRLARGGARS